MTPDAIRTHRFVARVCAKCGKGKGTTCFRYLDNKGEAARAYLHTKCARQFIVEQSA